MILPESIKVLTRRPLLTPHLPRAGHAESLHPLPADLTTDNETTVANSTFDRSFMNASSAALDSD